MSQSRLCLVCGLKMQSAAVEQEDSPIKGLTLWYCPNKHLEMDVLGNTCPECKAALVNEACANSKCSLSKGSVRFVMTTLQSVPTPTPVPTPNTPPPEAKVVLNTTATAVKPVPAVVKQGAGSVDATASVSEDVFEKYIAELKQIFAGLNGGLRQNLTSYKNAQRIVEVILLKKSTEDMKRVQAYVDDLYFYRFLIDVMSGEKIKKLERQVLFNDRIKPVLSGDLDQLDGDELVLRRRRLLVILGDPDFKNFQSELIAGSPSSSSLYLLKDATEDELRARSPKKDESEQQPSKLEEKDMTQPTPPKPLLTDVQLQVIAQFAELSVLDPVSTDRDDLVGRQVIAAALTTPSTKIAQEFQAMCLAGFDGWSLKDTYGRVVAIKNGQELKAHDAHVAQVAAAKKAQEDKDKMDAAAADAAAKLAEEKTALHNLLSGFEFSAPAALTVQDAMTRKVIAEDVFGVFGHLVTDTSIVSAALRVQLLLAKNGSELATVEKRIEDDAAAAKKAAEDAKATAEAQAKTQAEAAKKTADEAEAAKKKREERLEKFNAQAGGWGVVGIILAAVLAWATGLFIVVGAVVLRIGSALLKKYNKQGAWQFGAVALSILVSLTGIAGDWLVKSESVIGMILRAKDVVSRRGPQRTTAAQPVNAGYVVPAQAPVSRPIERQKTQEELCNEAVARTPKPQDKNTVAILGCEKDGVRVGVVEGRNEFLLKLMKGVVYYAKDGSGTLYPANTWGESDSVAGNGYRFPQYNPEAIVVVLGEKVIGQFTKMQWPIKFHHYNSSGKDLEVKLYQNSRIGLYARNGYVVDGRTLPVVFRLYFRKKNAPPPTK